jgi:hypothetical protein
MYQLLALIALHLHASSGAPSPGIIPSRLCAAELESLRFVAAPGGGALPLYWDHQLAAYLTQVYRRAHHRAPAASQTVVIPLYSAAPAIFRRGVHLFVTTGLLAQAPHDETALANRFVEPAPARDKWRKGATPTASSCEQTLAAGPPAHPFAWASFRDSLAAYEEWTRPRLKTRPAGRGLTDSPARP